MKRDLLLVLLGALAAIMVFVVVGAVQDFMVLEQRVDFIEGYIQALDQALRQQ